LLLSSYRLIKRCRYEVTALTSNEMWILPCRYLLCTPQLIEEYRCIHRRNYSSLIRIFNPTKSTNVPLRARAWRPWPVCTHIFAAYQSCYCLGLLIGSMIHNCMESRPVDGQPNVARSWCIGYTDKPVSTGPMVTSDLLLQRHGHAVS
jgi:hypothetical protein